MEEVPSHNEAAYLHSSVLVVLGKKKIFLSGEGSGVTL